MTGVFISYPRDRGAGQQWAEKLEDWLKSRGVPCFRDESDLDSSKPLPNELGSQIQSATLVLCVVSHSTNQSQWVTSEVLHAENNHVPIHQIVVEPGATFLPGNTRLRVDFTEDQEGGWQTLERVLTDNELLSTKTRANSTSLPSTWSAVRDGQSSSLVVALVWVLFPGVWAIITIFVYFLLQATDCRIAIKDGLVTEDPKEAYWFIYLFFSILMGIGLWEYGKRIGLSSTSLRIGLLSILLVFVAGSWGFQSTCKCYLPQKPWFEGMLPGVGIHRCSLQTLCVDYGRVYEPPANANLPKCDEGG